MQKNVSTENRQLNDELQKKLKNRGGIGEEGMEVNGEAEIEKLVDRDVGVGVERKLSKLEGKELITKTGKDAAEKDFIKEGGPDDEVAYAVGLLGNRKSADDRLGFAELSTKPNIPCPHPLSPHPGPFEGRAGLELNSSVSNQSQSSGLGPRSQDRPYLPVVAVKPFRDDNNEISEARNALEQVHGSNGAAEVNASHRPRLHVIVSGQLERDAGGTSPAAVDGNGKKKPHPSPRHQRSVKAAPRFARARSVSPESGGQRWRSGKIKPAPRRPSEQADRSIFNSKSMSMNPRRPSTTPKPASSTLKPSAQSRSPSPSSRRPSVSPKRPSLTHNALVPPSRSQSLAPNHKYRRPSTNPRFLSPTPSPSADSSASQGSPAHSRSPSPNTRTKRIGSPKTGFSRDIFSRSFKAHNEGRSRRVHFDQDDATEKARPFDETIQIQVSHEPVGEPPEKPRRLYLDIGEDRSDRVSGFCADDYAFPVDAVTPIPTPEYAEPQAFQDQNKSPTEVASKCQIPSAESGFDVDSANPYASPDKDDSLTDGNLVSGQPFYSIALSTEGDQQALSAAGAGVTQTALTHYDEPRSTPVKASEIDLKENDEKGVHHLDSEDEDYIVVKESKDGGSLKHVRGSTKNVSSTNGNAVAAAAPSLTSTKAHSFNQDQVKEAQLDKAPVDPFEHLYAKPHKKKKAVLEAESKPNPVYEDAASTNERRPRPKGNHDENDALDEYSDYAKVGEPSSKGTSTAATLTSSSSCAATAKAEASRQHWLATHPGQRLEEENGASQNDPRKAMQKAIINDDDGDYAETDEKAEPNCTPVSNMVDLKSAAAGRSEENVEVHLLGKKGEDPDYAEIDEKDESTALGTTSSRGNLAVTNQSANPSDPTSPSADPYNLTPSPSSDMSCRPFVRGFSLAHGTFPGEKTEPKHLPKRAKTEKPRNARMGNGSSHDDLSAVLSRTVSEGGGHGSKQAKSDGAQDAASGGENKPSHQVGPKGDLYARPLKSQPKT
jgi:hypothetical protein